MSSTPPPAPELTLEALTSLFRTPNIPFENLSFSELLDILLELLRIPPTATSTHEPQNADTDVVMDVGSELVEEDIVSVLLYMSPPSSSTSPSSGEDEVVNTIDNLAITTPRSGEMD